MSAGHHRPWMLLGATLPIWFSLACLESAPSRGEGPDACPPPVECIHDPQSDTSNEMALEATLGPLRGTVDLLRVSSDGMRLAAVDSRGDLSVWGLAGQRLEHRSHVGESRLLEFSPTGRYLAVINSEGLILWMTADYSKSLLIEGSDDGGFSSAVFYPHGTHIATRGDSLIRVWNLANGREVVRQDLLEDRTHGSATAMVASPTRSRLITLADDAVVFRDSATLAKVSSRELLYPSRLAATPDGRTLVIAYGDNAEYGIAAIDMQRERVTDVVDLPNGMSADYLAVAPDGQRVAFSGYETIDELGPTLSLYIWTIADGRIEKLHDHGGYDPGFSADGALLVAGTETNAAVLWNPLDGKLLTSARGHRADVTAVEFALADRALATASDNFVRLWVRAPLPHSSSPTGAGAPDGGASGEL